MFSLEEEFGEPAADADADVEPRLFAASILMLLILLIRAWRLMLCIDTCCARRWWALLWLWLEPGGSGLTTASLSCGPSWLRDAFRACPAAPEAACDMRPRSLSGWCWCVWSALVTASIDVKDIADSDRPYVSGEMGRLPGTSLFTMTCCCCCWGWGWGTGGATSAGSTTC